MSHTTLAKFQIGKNGVTEGVLESLISAFKHRKQVRISVLKSATRNREEIKKISQEIIEKLPFKLNRRIIGFTIVLLKTNK